MKLLEGKTALVTGAARGIGKGIALKFAAEGANIAFTDLVIDENGEATKAEIEALGVKCVAYASNAADFAQTEEVVAKVKEDLKGLNADYKVLIAHTGNNTFAYSKLTKEIENLVLKLSVIEECLDSTLDTLGSMKEDELRARQQLEEVKIILKNSKAKMREYNLPVIPKNYYVELNEASNAIKEIVRELDRKPITIDVLNTRVDTARDLVLKLFSKTKEMMKTAMFAEMAIVYGNRYRSTVLDLDKNLTYAELLFHKGEYQRSLELTINALNRIEPGIYNKLLNLYGNEK